MPSSAPLEIYPLSLHDALPILKPRINLVGDGAGKMGFPGAGRAVEDDPARRVDPEMAIDVRRRQRKLDQLANELDLLAQASDVLDRKSTRLNSSHVEISYAVFCAPRDLPSFPTRRSSDLKTAHQPRWRRRGQDGISRRRAGRRG